MKSNRNIWFVAALFLGLSGVSTYGQQQPRWCNSRKLDAVTEKDYRIIDARPSEPNKVTGKMAFKNKARVAIVNMNPFMFKYEVKVDQTQIQDTAVLDFLKLLGAPITDLAEIASFRAVADSQDAESLKNDKQSDRLTVRTEGNPEVPAKCEVATAKQAIDYLEKTRKDMLDLKEKIDTTLEQRKKEYMSARTGYLRNQSVLYSPSAETAEICSAANNMMIERQADDQFIGFLKNDTPYQATTYPARGTINELKELIAQLDSLITDLEEGATTFKDDQELKDCQPRLHGFLYADSLITLAKAMKVNRAAFEKRAATMSDETKAYDFLVKTIRTFATDDGAGKISGGSGPGMKLFQRTFDIKGQYDISALDIQLIPTELQPLKPFDNPDEIDAFRAKMRLDASAQSGYDRFSRRTTNGVSVNVVGATEDQSQNATSRSSDARTRSSRSANSFASDQPADKPAEDNRTRANATIGARRFELSAGMAFSTLDRREFKSVLGYARNPDGVIIDTDGKPTDKRDLTNIVGFTESTKQRFAPLVMLNTRITNNPKYNLFFSVGVTAKKDSEGTDVEYLLGPSFNFLNKNAFFTFGGYAGRQQKLAGDLFVGAKLPGTDVSIRKEYKWAPAFSFTYRIPIKGESGH